MSTFLNSVPSSGREILVYMWKNCQTLGMGIAVGKNVSFWRVSECFITTEPGLRFVISSENLSVLYSLRTTCLFLQGVLLFCSCVCFGVKSHPGFF